VSVKELTNTSFSLENNILKLSGKLSLKEVNHFIKAIEYKLQGFSCKHLIINLDDLEDIDTSGITSIYYLYDKYTQRGIKVEFEGGNTNIKRKLDLFRPEKPEVKYPEVTPGFFEMLGHKISFLFNEYILGFIQLAADITFWSFTDLFRKQMRRKAEWINQAVQIGVNAAFIVGSMAFIIGLVLALQSAAQLRSFGANIYIVDLTVIAMMSEMGPLITAIMVAGRSSSAIAAEIATMKVTSEIDALRTMGLNPVRFVVVPKMYGAILTLPFLTVIANVLGIAGSMVIAVASLDITPVVFYHRMQESLLLKDIIFGVIKSIVFAFLIVLTGSFFGFRVKYGAEGVGKVTTVAVVVTISLVIIADSIMGLLFY
jgi:phospholipid/cholesterol/gamma-HCH transport system permease protein